MKKRKLAVVISHPTQHFVPLYVQLSRYSDLELNVFYVAENGVSSSYDEQFAVDVQWDTPMLNGYKYEFVEPGKVLDDFGFFSVDSKEITSALTDFAPDWLWVHGYSQRVNWRAIRAIKPHTKVLYTSDSNIFNTEVHNQGGVRKNLKEKIKKIIISQFFNAIDCYLSIGPANKAYLLHYGAKENQLVPTTFPVDIDRLVKQKESLQNEDLISLREKYGIPSDSKIILVVGKLMLRKRVGNVIDALSTLSDSSTHLLIVGSGECETRLREQVKAKNLSARVHFAGFINQMVLPAYFSIADVLVFPSENEPYGAVVSEALPFI